MYNSEQHKASFMSPRISFSNDFVESQQMRNSIKGQTQALTPASSDFEFSVASDSMMSADELFSQGKLLPFKQNQFKRAATTLRDELLLVDEDESGAGSSSARPPKGSSTKWKGILGLNKRTQSMERAPETRRPSSSLDKYSKSSKTRKGNFRGGASNCDDMEMDS